MSCHGLMTVLLLLVIVIDPLKPPGPAAVDRVVHGHRSCFLGGGTVNVTGGEGRDELAWLSTATTL